MEDFESRIPNPSPVNGEEDDQFPIGLKVLAIDANIVCLRYLVGLLQKCRYKVSATTDADEAIRLLKDGKQGFDLVITNVVRHDMDGFKILQVIGVGMGIPVVMVSASEELEMVKRGVMEGADAYLLKPVRLEELRIIWQHVLRRRLARRRPNPNVLLLEQATVVEEEDHNITERVTMDKQDYEREQIIKLDDDNNNVASSSSSNKKHRISWTKELHEKFVKAYEQLGEKERVPNNILKLMNDPNMTRENVASHLQKHRDTLRKKKASGVGKFSKKSFYDRNPTKASTLYNSMNHINKVSNLGPQLPISGQLQFPNRARSSMEGLQGYQNPRSSGFPVPEFKWFNFPSNNSFSRPCNDYNDQYPEGFGRNNTNSYLPLESNYLNSTSESFVGNYPVEMSNVGIIIPDQAASLAWSSFPNNSLSLPPPPSGQSSQMQFNAGNLLGNSLMGDDLAEIFKQEFKSEGVF